MQVLKKLLTVFFICAIIIAVAPQNASATCSHSSLGERYSEATHPHEYFRYCNLCGEKVYVGGHATKNHGDGSWGSGTCPDCGTHTYVGRSCEDDGECACGATISAYGHNPTGEYFYDVAHPHYEYQFCSRCGEAIYTGNYRVKNHGDGSWGSGTCPDCGTHTFVGQTCTTGGTCACGVTAGALGHIYNSSLQYESNHPHREYRQCERCVSKLYTGNNGSKPHGDGTNGTCSSCGSHSFVADGDYSMYSTHPHESHSTCSACGYRKTNYTLEEFCSLCRENEMTAYSSNSLPTFLIYFDQGNMYPQLGAPITVPLTFTVEYTNWYNHPRSNTNGELYNYPVFASFGAREDAYTDCTDPSVPTIIITNSYYAHYYDSNNTLIESQSMTYVSPSTSSAFLMYPLIFGNTPSHVISSASCNVSGSSVHRDLSTTTYFY